LKLHPLFFQEDSCFGRYALIFIKRNIKKKCQLSNTDPSSLCYGLPDDFSSLGAGSTVKITDKVQLNFINKEKGKIFLQVQDRGQAWYVNPLDGKRYLLGSKNDINAIIKKSGLGISDYNNSVFVDCTANAQAAGLYAELLNANVSIVTANKVAASSDYENYAILKKTAKRKGVKFLFETNVGAGLPIITTLNDLVNSGDTILKIEAVLSGTLNFIFNTISDKIPLSQTIRMAKDQGFAEPDPRIDLSGVDVARKLLILVRESGYQFEMKDIKINTFIPEKYFEGSVEDFWKNIPEMDIEFEAGRKKLADDGRFWRFVAKFDEGKAEIGLQEIIAGHPFADLQGSNNLVMFTTERYHEFPMIIKGYGAGAAVTAAGVFADIIRVSNI